MFHICLGLFDVSFLNSLQAGFDILDLLGTPDGIHRHPYL